MKRLFTLIVLLAGSAQADVPGATPAAVVRSFVADYAAWNFRANARAKQQPLEAAVKIAEREYAALIARYCKPGFKHQPISFGDESDHEPINEVVISESTAERRSVVRTKHTRKHAHGQFVADYEYHLSFESRRWYLRSVLYVDSKGKYEGL